MRGAALGVAIAGLILWLHTFQALGMLQFAPSVETQRTFVAWTSAMLAAPIVILASALLIALSDIPRLGRGFLAALGMTLAATAILAARTWENVEGFLLPSDAGLPMTGTPLRFEDWPFVYHHGWWLFGGVAVAAVAVVALAAWRARPLHAVPLLAGVAIAIAAIVVGGSVGFSQMSFLRLRNWSLAVAALDAVVVALSVRDRRGIVAVLLLLVVLAGTWQLHASWTALYAELPHDVPAPWW
jgi:hypothetical protein